MKQASHIVILGAGIAGLATAWYLQRFSKGGFKITLVEKTARVGGWIETIEKDGFLFENGPRGFRPKGKGKKTLDLAREAGLTEELLAASPKAKKRYIWFNQQLHSVSPLLLFQCGFLQAALKEWFMPPSDSGADESIQAFFLRRFNGALTSRLIEPLVQGIFGGRASALSLRSCFPLLSQWEQVYGSVVKGFWNSRKKREKEHLPPLCSFRRGMESLPQALAAKLQADWLLSTEVEAIVGREIRTSQGILEADHIVAALPAHVLEKICPAAYLSLSPLPFLTLTTIHLGYRGSVLKKRGFGYLVPLHAEEGVLGMTWDSEIFPQQDHGVQTRLCVMFRGEKSKEELLPLILKTVTAHLGITQAPQTLVVHTSRQAIPQYPVGFDTRLRSLCIPHVSFVGSSYGGVGINDCVAQAELIAHQICQDF